MRHHLILLSLILQTACQVNADSGLTGSSPHDSSSNRLLSMPGLTQRSPAHQAPLRRLAEWSKLKKCPKGKLFPITKIPRRQWSIQKRVRQNNQIKPKIKIQGLFQGGRLQNQRSPQMEDG
jgi:hypothetical protein